MLHPVEKLAHRSWSKATSTSHGLSVHLGALLHHSSCRHQSAVSAKQSRDSSPSFPCCKPCAHLQSLRESACFENPHTDFQTTHPASQNVPCALECPPALSGMTISRCDHRQIKQRLHWLGVHSDTRMPAPRDTRLAPRHLAKPPRETASNVASDGSHLAQWSNTAR